jgi:hypothetical protein
MSTPPSAGGSRGEPAATDTDHTRSAAEETTGVPVPASPAPVGRRRGRQVVAVVAAALALALSGAGAFAVGQLVTDDGPAAVHDGDAGRAPGRGGHHHGHDLDGGPAPDGGGLPAPGGTPSGGTGPGGQVT